MASFRPQARAGEDLVFMKETTGEPVAHLSQGVHQIAKRLRCRAYRTQLA